MRYDEVLNKTIYCSAMQTAEFSLAHCQVVSCERLQTPA